MASRSTIPNSLVRAMIEAATIVPTVSAARPAPARAVSPLLRVDPLAFMPPQNSTTASKNLLLSAFTQLRSVVNTGLND
jgi:hypothetical protein